MSDKPDVDRPEDGEREIEAEGNDSDTSRRTVLRGMAAGSIAGVAGLGGAQETTTEGEGADGQETAQQGPFFEQGTEVGTQVVADGQLTAPTDFADMQGGDRQFVTDQTGQVYIITQDGLRDEPFMDVSDRMVELGTFFGLYADPQQSYDERGLLGIDLHPNFQENRKFYLHYSAPPTEELRSINWDHIEIVSEFQATEDLSSGNPDSERQLLSIPSPQYNHDSGPMAFGPDGYLYVPMGDGGGANDDMYGHVPDWYDRNTGGNGQDIVHNLLGDILRIDVDSEGEDTPYGIPEDNPFAGEAPGRDEIYAYGFRNPFGISFDSDGNMFVADAGQNLWEEANIVEKGGNYGWNVKEGTHCFSTEQPSDPSAITDCPSNAPDQPYGGEPLQDPIVEYPHQYQGNNVGIVIIGGHRYEQNTISGLNGKYIFGDFTKDPTRGDPQGRVLTAEPPADFGQGGQTETTPEETTPGGQTTTEEAALQDETPTETTTIGKAPAGTETPGAETTTPVADEEGTQDIPPEGPQVVPRDQLWTMRELVFTNEFNWFVRQFGQDSDGEIYVLVSKRGIPEGDTGAVLKLVPAGEGDQAGQTTQTTEEETAEGTTTIGKDPAGTETPGAGTTTPEDQ